MSENTPEDQEDDASGFGEFDEVAPDFKIDPGQDKKISLERRRKIEDKIELFRLRDESGFYDLEI